MSLLSKLREKQSGKFATATVATFATQPSIEAATVAKIARIAVANPRNAETTIHRASSHTPEELEVLAWLGAIGEHDPLVIAETIDKCRAQPCQHFQFFGRVTAGAMNRTFCILWICDSDSCDSCDSPRLFAVRCRKCRRCRSRKPAGLLFS